MVTTSTQISRKIFEENSINSIPVPSIGRAPKMSATDVSDVVVVTSSSQKKMMWALSGTLVFLALSVFYNVSLRNDVEATRTFASSYAMEHDALKKELDASASLRSELVRTKQVLVSEIARKKELAVMYERAESARKQAVADHKVLADKLRAYENKKKK